MKRITDNIKDQQTRKYFNNVVNETPQTEQISTEQFLDGIGKISENMREVAAMAREELAARHKMGNITEAISLSYIAKTYFGKSRAWLMQKVNGNTVNGKRASFTPSESKRMREALQDLSEKLSKAALAF
ncbi:DUF5053 domain-containing protein [Prevotella sp. tf2-5]|uniref:DUF5053 domain-containing protein n=1 Tax=Prevotella sp. tf2-5 TaxID=1761889 RepID=UPI0008E4DF3E|nr:DUF5053 domain-containing protein [Prevotella sp. tf2-5]SFO62383.1 protein of unknown function [Prevotella sp. tf2-5]